MLSSTFIVSLLSLTPLALAVPTSSSSQAHTHQLVEKRGFGHGGGYGYGYGGLGGGGYFGGGFGGRNRRFKEAEFARKHKNKQLLAAERKNHLNFDKDTALAAKNYKEVNFGAEKDRKFDNADLRKAKVAELAKEKDARKHVNFREGGGGGFWKRQFEDDEGGEGGDLGSDDSIDSSYSPEGGVDSSNSIDQDGFDGGLYDGGLYDGGLYDGGDFGGIGDGFDYFGGGGGGGEGTNDQSNSYSTPDLDQLSPDSTSSSSSPQDSPASTSSSPDQVGIDQQPDAGSLTKRGFGGYGGGFGGYGGYGGERFRKDSRFHDAKLIRLAELEQARRRKALDRAKVRFNTKKFNELKFKNDVHLNKDNKAKEIALAHRKDKEAARVKKLSSGGGWW